MTSDDRVLRFFDRLNELDDPSRPSRYALYSLLIREFEEAIAEEREACLRIVEHIADDGIVPDCSVKDIAAAIRART